MRSVVALALTLFATAVAMAPLSAARIIETLPEVQDSADDWFEKLPQALGKPKFTQIRVFIHDILQGADPSVVPIAQANVTATSPTQFALVAAVDDPLTEGQGLSTALVGRAEGIIIYASKETVRVIFTGNFLFTEGEYKGSSLSVVGQVASSAPSTEFPVSGGTGAFRLAQGIATTLVNPPDAQGTVAVECRFKLLHY